MFNLDPGVCWLYSSCALHMRHYRGGWAIGAWRGGCSELSTEIGVWAHPRTPHRRAATSNQAVFGLTYFHMNIACSW
jgi:hypothetical protein